jgi:hypothetical protein
MLTIMNISQFVCEWMMRVIYAANASRARKKTQFSDVKKNEKIWMISLYIKSLNMNDD